MTKTVSKVVVYFTDGTFQEVGGNFFGGGGGSPEPFKPFDNDGVPYDRPGKIGTWPFPPDGTGITIVD
jgi:hypothetical protein